MDQPRTREHRMVTVPSADGFDAARDTVWRMRYLSSSHTDGDIMRAVVKELFGFDLDPVHR